jgi:hypothetical protein
METKFTKGEWVYNKYEPSDYGVHSEEGDGRDIALVRSLNNEQESEANAKLIANSPKMFDHLLSFIHYIEQEKLTVSGALLAEMDSAKRTVKQIITNDQ